MAASEKDRINRVKMNLKSNSITSNSDRRLADIVSFLPEPTFVVDKESIVISWNRTMEDLTGIGALDILDIGNYEYAIHFYGFRRPILADPVLYPDKNIEQNMRPAKPA